MSTITIRRCNGNRDAWAAGVGESEMFLTTGLSLDELIKRVEERWMKPDDEIVIVYSRR